MEFKIFSSLDETSVTILWKATDRYFHVVLFALRYSVVLTFCYVDQTCSVITFFFAQPLNFHVVLYIWSGGQTVQDNVRCTISGNMTTEKSTNRQVPN